MPQQIGHGYIALFTNESSDGPSGEFLWPDKAGTLDVNGTGGTFNLQKKDGDGTWSDVPMRDSVTNIVVADGRIERVHLGKGTIYRGNVATASAVYAGIRFGANDTLTQAQPVDGVVPSKPSVVTVGMSNIALATAAENGDTISGHVLTTGETFLAAAQTDKSENGPWVVAASGSPTRPAWAANGSTTALLAGDTIRCTEGNYRGTTWHLITTGTITVDTTAQTWVPESIGINTGRTGTHALLKYFFVPERLDVAASPLTVTAEREYFIFGRWPVNDGGMISITVRVQTALPASKLVLAVYRLSHDFVLGDRVMRDDTLTADTTGEKQATFSEIPFYYGELFAVGVYCDDAIGLLRPITAVGQFPILRTIDSSQTCGVYRASATTFENAFADPLSFNNLYSVNANIPVATVGY